MKLSRFANLSVCLFVSSILTADALVAGDEDPAGETGKNLSVVAITALKAQIAIQQQQIDQLRQTLETQQKLLDRAVATPQFPKLGEVAGRTPVVPLGSSSSASPAALQKPGAEGTSNVSPLSFGIGAAKFTPFGFVDLTQVIRSTNAGGGIGTTFSGIPLNNTVQGKLSESRFSLQNSRVGLRVDSQSKGTDITGYLETDFLGNAPTNLTVTSNAATLRLRLFWAQFKRDKWELLAGQSWSMMTPGRKGISPIPGDLFYSQDVDTNYQNGLTWARQPTLRFVYHPTKEVSWGLGVEASDQYVGGAVTFPAALGVAYPAEFNNGTAGTATPNLTPDFVSKLAFDTTVGGKAMHAEIGGLLRTFRAYNPLTDQHFTHIGGGGEVGLNLEVAKGFRLIGNGYVSDGGGRYIFGSGPDLIAKLNGDISLVHAASTVDGFEYSYKPKDNPSAKESLFFAYYGGAYFRKNFGFDPVSKAFFGYGFPNGSLAANRSINQFTVGVHQTFWKSANYGDVRLLTQYSYLSRDPWSVPATNPQRNASVNMLFLNLRYDLP